MFGRCICVRAVRLCRASSQLLDSQAVTTPGAGPRRPKSLMLSDLRVYYAEASRGAISPLDGHKSRSF